MRRYSEKRVRETGGKEHAVTPNEHGTRAITAPFALAKGALPLTMGGGLIPPPNPRVAAPVVVGARGSVALQQGEVLTAVLVQVVADGL